MRLIRSWGVLLIILSVVLAACASTAQSPSPSAAEASEEPEASAASAEPEPSEDPVAGQTVRVVYASDGVGINDFVAIGVTHFLLSLRADDLDRLHDDMEWFASQVMPLIQRHVRRAEKVGQH